MSTERTYTSVHERLQDLELVDHHAHSVLQHPAGPSEIQSHLTESDAPPGPSVFDSQVGFALRRHCAPLLGLPAHATVGDYLAARAEFTPRQLAQLMLHAAGVSNWLVDTGFNSPSLLSLGELASLGVGTVHEIVRLEAVLESTASATSAGRLQQDFVEALGVRADQAHGFKSIVAYRHGLAIDPTRPSHTEVRAAADRWLRSIDRGAPVRVSDPVLLRMSLWSAVDTGLPLQIHAGFGDPDLDLHRADPLLLTPFIRAVRECSSTALVLLHCYPFHRQAGYLAHAFENVYVDVGLATNYLGAAAPSLIAESLELAPFGKVLYSSDAYGLPELHFLGSRLWRRCLTGLLAAWIAEGDWNMSDAIRVAESIGRGNAVDLYGLPA